MLTTLNNITVSAAILSVKHSFTVQNFDQGAKLGNLTVFGGIYQYFRGPVGTGGGTGTGYGKDYNYDTRLKSLPPPSFLDPEAAPWKATASGRVAAARRPRAVTRARPRVRTCSSSSAWSRLAGLAIGSFLNVVVWRVPRGESVVSPPSACPACEAAIRPRDNVPVAGWLLLRGRCRDCSTAISPRYPLVEAATAGLFVVLALRLGADPVLPAYLYLAAVGLALALIDVDVHKLPDRLTLPSYVVVAGLLGLGGAARQRQR